ncbi:MAG: type II toxin-antitoxin system RelE/ParE family toxin [Desulfovibrio sp.]|jgi:toxin ParE1/3/4|nr:type II toxin-antitoxin system RelE/ParE family toxin [Desulfovibrio sp.]
MIAWSESARDDLGKVEARLSQQGKTGLGKEIVSRINLAAERLKHFPLAGRKGRIAGTRELMMPQNPYLVVYIVEKPKHIGIVRVLPVERLWPENIYFQAGIPPCG